MYKPVTGKASCTHGCVFMLRSQWKIKYVQLHLPAEECLLKLHTKKKPGEVFHCMFFIWMMNIYTQLNVYMWMYLRNSRIVLIISVKSSVGKQGRKCLPFMSTLWSPPLPELLHRHQKTHTCHTTHTSTHAYTQIIKCPTQNIPETILKLLSVNKQTPTYSSDRIDADV